MFSFITILLTIQATYAQDIVGCGGFVQSSVPIPYEKVQVKLYTKQGAFKSQVECAPNNGYFLVAVYDKGDYVLRIDPPEGWAFTPLEIPLQIDGENDPCSKGADLNFKFVGFSISGMVVSTGRDIGPAEVAVDLIDTEGTQIAETKTDNVGKFIFNQVMPGKYIVKAKHPTWVFKQDQVEVNVIDDNIALQKEMIVAGYDVKGYVLSGGEAIQGVSFVLISEEVKKQDITNCKQVSSDILHNIKKTELEEVLCWSLSEADGSFRFPTIPSGTYTLVPYYEANGIVFDILPQKLSFTVNYQSVEFKTPFQVYGFSVQGRVVDSKSNGIEGVVINTVGESGEVRKSFTNVDGRYVLENITTGHYGFKLEKEHHFFDEEKIHITPNTPVLKDIIVKQYHVCGSIEVSNLPTGVLPVNKHKVLLHPDGDANTNVRTTLPQKNGAFCFKVSPGKYRIEVPLTEDERKNGFLLQPSYHMAVISAAPVLNIQFKQFRANVKGTVKCIEDCKDVIVYLTHTEKPDEKHYAQGENDGKQMHFVFTNILPGKYKVVPQRKKWCWDPLYVDIEVKDNDVDNVKLVHSGYYLKCSISHSITLNFQLENSNETVGVFELKQGSNQFCLKTPGIYSLTPKSCYRFEKETYSYNTADPKSISLTVDSYPANVEIVATKEVTNLKLNVISLSSNKKEWLTPAFSSKTADNKFVYKATFWGGLAEEFSVIPFSNEILFYPDKGNIVITENCPGASITLEGQEGMFIEGRISPPLPGVAVTVTTLATEKYKQSIREILTNEMGRYKVGPFHSDVQYEVTAFKKGYHIKPRPDEKGSFLAQKLAQLTVKVQDEIGTPKSSVLLSLSGGQYRNNNLTSEDGFFIFQNLGPGQYFLRPMQKEYSFSPVSKMIDILEGADIIETIVGKRVAFSCTGTLSSLSGIPGEKIAIEAVGLHRCSEYHETTMSDNKGRYRLSGLHPGCTYNIRLAKTESNSRIERLSPANQLTHIQQEDITNTKFIVFEKPSQFDLSVHIETEFHYLSSLRVLLFDMENLDSPLHIIKPSVIKYIQFPPLKPKMYMVKLQSTLSSKTHETRATSATVTPDENISKMHIKLKFDATVRKVDLEPTQSVVALPLAVAMVFLAYNYDSVLVFLLKVNSFIQNFNKGESSETESDQDEELSRSSKKKKR